MEHSSFVLWNTAAIYTRQFLRDVTRKTKHTHEKKIQLLSERQSKPLRTVKDTVKFLDDSISPPSWVTDLLCLGPKHPILDKLRELKFLADVDSLLRTLKENDASNDCLCSNEHLMMRQSKPLRTVKDTVKFLDDSISPPSWVTDLLCLGPKHPILDKLRELKFLADVDSLLRTLKENDASNDCLSDVNALAQWYVKKAKQQQPDHALSKVNHYLKRNDIKAVTFDKGSGFALMTSNQYEKNFLEVLSGDQFQTLRAVKVNPLLLKIEERFDKSLQILCDHGSISQEFYQSTRATGSQPARLYGLAKVHKDNMPLRPVLSLPGSCYHKLNKVLSRFFDKVPGANIETCTPSMKELLASSTIDEDETIFSLDVKSLYTNVAVQEAMIHAVECLYSSECVPEFEKDVFIQPWALVLQLFWRTCG